VGIEITLAEIEIYLKITLAKIEIMLAEIELYTMIYW
jgi:hypothetical protein